MKFECEILPIESAPKDGTRVHVYRPPVGCRPGSWEYATWDAQPHNKKPRPFWSSCDHSSYADEDRNNPPTHWATSLPGEVIGEPIEPVDEVGE